MRKNQIIAGSILLLGILFFPGCQKEIQEDNSTKSEAELQSLGYHDHNKDCRLSLNEGDNEFSQVFLYNDKGLVEDWAYSEGGFSDRTTFEYDWKNRISKVRYYLMGEFLYTMIPEYKFGKIVKQTWYVGESDVIDDENFLTYNWRGQLIKFQSFVYDTYITYKYDFWGNAYKQEYFTTDGTPLYNFTFSFTKPVKNPMLSVKGFPAALFGVFEGSPWRQTALKAAYFDVDGIPVTYIDQDPLKSILKAGSQNYAIYQNFYDKLNDTWLEQTWCYENCGPGHDCGQSKADSNPGASVNKQGVVNKNALPILRGPMKRIKEKMKELRLTFKDKINK